jgi:hypothetical protein
MVIGVDNRICTGNLVYFKDALYELSYIHKGWGDPI